MSLRARAMECLWADADAAFRAQILAALPSDPSAVLLDVGCEGGEANLPHVVRFAGSEAVLYSSDFPHEVNN